MNLFESSVPVSDEPQHLHFFRVNPSEGPPIGQGPSVAVEAAGSADARDQRRLHEENGIEDADVEPFVPGAVDEDRRLLANQARRLRVDGGTAAGLDEVMDPFAGG